MLDVEQAASGSPGGAARWHQWTALRWPLAVFCLHQILSFTIVYWSLGLKHAGANANWLFGLARWDGGWYLALADRGYTTPESAAFYPLYPWLVRLLHAATGLQTLHAALLLTNVCFLAALITMYRYALSQYSALEARAATAILAFMPASLFFSAAYPESLFLLLSAAALTMLHERRYRFAALLIGLATLTRPQGLCLVAAALPDAYRALRARESAAGPLLAALGAAMGLLIYMAVLQIQLGDGLAFMHAQAHWHRQLVFPGMQLLSSIHILLVVPMSRMEQSMQWLNVLTGLLAIALTARYGRRGDQGAFLYVAAYLLLTLSSSPAGFRSDSVARYATAAVPLYCWVAGPLLSYRFVLGAVLLVNTLLFVVLQAMFALEYWVT